MAQVVGSLWQVEPDSPKVRATVELMRAHTRRILSVLDGCRLDKPHLTAGATVDDYLQWEYREQALNDVKEQIIRRYLGEKGKP